MGASNPTGPSGKKGKKDSTGASCPSISLNPNPMNAAMTPTCSPAIRICATLEFCVLMQLIPTNSASAIAAIRVVHAATNAELRDQFGSKRAKRSRVETAGDQLGEPAAPAGKETPSISERGPGPDIGSACLRHHGGKLHIAAADDQRDDPVEHEGEQQSGSGLAGGKTGQDEDARPDHRSYSQGDNRREPHLPPQPLRLLGLPFLIPIIRHCVELPLY